MSRIEDLAGKVADDQLLTSDEKQDFLKWFRTTSALLDGLFNRSGVRGNIDNLAEISPNAGLLYGFDLMAVPQGFTSLTPNDGIFDGGFLSALGWDFNSINYKFGLVKAGLPGVGMSTDIAQFGENISNPDKTALSIFHIAQNYNSESMAAGAAMFGSNSASKANMLWNPANNRLEFRGGTTVQAYVDTDGKIGFGAGAGSLSATGLVLEEGSATTNQVRWVDSAVDLLRIYAERASSVDAYIVATGESFTPDAHIYLRARSDGGTESFVSLNAINAGQSTIVLNVLSHDVDTAINWVSGTSIFAEGSTGNVGVKNGAPSVALDVTGDGKYSGALSVGGVATFTGNPIITNTTPSLAFTDTTGSAKSLTIAVDANVADFRESAGASASLLQLDLANLRVGVAMAAARTLDVTGTFGATGAATLGSTLSVGGGPAIATLDEGTYTPTLTNGANVAASTAFSCAYFRVGNMVIVSGRFNVDPTAAAPTATELGISLPIASAFTSANFCWGVCNASNITSESGAITADATNDRASVVWNTVSAANHTMYFIFMYQII